MKKHKLKFKKRSKLSLRDTILGKKEDKLRHRMEVAIAEAFPDVEKRHAYMKALVKGLEK